MTCEDHPVSKVIWADADLVRANDYNPNTVAPPEMKLLKLSIRQDGITQPVVAYKDGDSYVVVDGFHRTMVIKNDKTILSSTGGMIPLVVIDKPITERMASTIRHNRARGKHTVTKMSDIVASLTEQGWADQRIATELGMDAEEVLRLKQLSGLASLFNNKEFSRAWE